MMFHALANTTSTASWIYEMEYENGVIDIFHDRQHYEPLADASTAGL